MSNDQYQTSYKRFKTPHDESFTTIPNKLILDKRLSDAAFRILIYLLHNSPDWKVYQKKMMSDLDHGRDKCKEGVALLENLGYLRRRQVREAGKFAHYEYEYYHTPIFAECSQVPVHTVNKPTKKKPPATEKPAPVNPHLPMTNLTSNLKIRKDNVKPAIADLTLQSKNQESSKKAKTMDITKRYCLSEQQCVAFNLMKEARLPTDDPTLCFYAKNFSLERVNAALIEMRAHRPSNAGGYFRKLLMKKLDESKANTLMNSEFAQQYKEALGWKELVITKTHVETSQFKLALISPVDIFIEALTSNMPKC
jgi:hypothetical protein